MILSSIVNGIMARRQRERAEEQRQLALGRLDRADAELDNLFNSQYYRDYMQRADVQSLINSAKANHEQQISQLRNRGVVMGGTDEFIGAQINGANQSMANLYSNLAAQGQMWKDNVLNSYVNRKAALNDKYFASYLSNANSYDNSASMFLSQALAPISKMDDAMLGMATGSAYKKLNL